MNGKSDSPTVDTKVHLGNERCDECHAITVQGVAIMRGKLVFWMPRPARHSDLIREMAAAGIQTPIGHGDDIQGFMTSVGFKDRVLTGRLTHHMGLLTSEDMW